MLPISYKTALFLAFIPAYGAEISVYLSPPTDQSSSFPGIVTETFDGLNTGNHTDPFLSAIGTYDLSPSSPFFIGEANQFGGADSTSFMSIGVQSSSTNPVVIKLPSPQRYFGFWWSAGDSQNGISFYSGSKLLARFVTADIVNLLSPPSGQVQAIDGNFYDNAEYYGNPNSPPDRNTIEPYAYVNIVADGFTFDRVLLDNSGTIESGFETDNHSIYAEQPTVPSDHVFVTDIPVSPVPEPSTSLLLGAALLSGVWAARRRTAADQDRQHHRRCATAGQPERRRVMSR